MQVTNLLVDSHEKNHWIEYKAGVYTLGYYLSKPLQFKEPAYARLLYFQGAGPKAILVFADFVAAQEVNGRKESLLGISKAVNTWVPLANGFVPSIGTLTLRSVDTGTTIGANKHFTILIQLASQSWVAKYGA